MSRRHEPNRIATGTLLAIAATMTACLLAIAALIYWMVQLGADGGPGKPVATIPPQPRLQAHAPADRARMLAIQRAELVRYQWIDRAHGIARIPVKRAMALVAEGVRAGAPRSAAGTSPAAAGSVREGGQ